MLFLLYMFMLHAVVLLRVPQPVLLHSCVFFTTASAIGNMCVSHGDYGLGSSTGKLYTG